MIAAPRVAPIPMPAFAPVEKVEVDVGNEVPEGSEVVVGPVN